MPPDKRKKIYRLIARFFSMAEIPAITPALVPGPVIKNASIAPSPAPPFNNVWINGTADSPFTYKGSPIKAASGTANTFLELNNPVINEAGTKWLIKKPIAAKTV